MIEFLAMDGYAQFVWPSFGLTAAVLAWMLVDPWRRHRKLRARIGAGR